MDKNDIKGFGIIIKEIPCCNRYKGYIKEEKGYYFNRWKFWKIIKIRNLWTIAVFYWGFGAIKRFMLLIKENDGL